MGNALPHGFGGCNVKATAFHGAPQTLQKRPVVIDQQQAGSRHIGIGKRRFGVHDQVHSSIRLKIYYREYGQNHELVLRP
jgi:hypothetical protein